jgi:hypothetical protein
MEDLKVILFFNAKIITMDKNDNIYDAMGIFQDKILAIGKENQVRKEINHFLENKSTVKIEERDLEGGCIVPGFIDSHMHPGMYIYFKTQLDLSGVRNYSGLKKILMQADKERKEGEWIIGFDLMEDIFDEDSEKHFPTRWDIDKYCPNRPVVIMRHDGHICAVNTLVLREIDLNKDTVKEKTPESGEIRIDKDGIPSGIFTEEATALALTNVAIPDFNTFNEATVKMSKELASYGITTCGGIIQLDETGPAGKTGAMEWDLIQLMIKKDLIEQDFVFYYSTDRPKKLKRLKKSVSKLSEVKNKFTVGGLKIYSDGSFGAHTACLYEPFSDLEDNEKNPSQEKVKKSGFMVREFNDMYNLSKEAFDIGFQVIIHAIGDKANRIVVNVFNKVITDSILKNDDKYFRIEHASMLKQDVLEDSSRLGIIMACQPNFINSEYTWLENRLGSERIKYTYPFKSIIDNNILLAAASDAPVESANVLEGIFACVTRNGFVPEESISIREALKMYTINAATALRQEDIKGSLEKGKLADFVIINRDIEAIKPDEILNIEIKNTYHRGKIIY